MIFVKILLGLIGLGVVVFIHELGHFLAARAVGIDVEAFSIGWGKPLIAKKIGGVEYRLGMFPVGGYCKMRGESEFKEAWEHNKNEIPQEKGTFFGAHPAGRILVAFAGPFFNILFAVVVFAFIWGIGFDVTTMDNKIVLVSDVNPGESYPADKAGLHSGDKIIDIDGKTISDYHDIQSVVAVNAEKNMRFTVLRDGKEMELYVKSDLDKSTGAGRIGVYFWADPIVDSVAKDSAAEKAGIKPGDIIAKVNGEDLKYSVALLKWLDPAAQAATHEASGDASSAESAPLDLNLEINRGGNLINTVLAIPRGGEDPIGIAWKAVEYHTPHYSIPGAAAKGFAETWETLVVSVRSLGLLFRGIDLTKAVSGPVRITYMAGDIATYGFSQSFATGLRGVGNFLALISIALAVMNLLPLPVLDGGLIVIFLVELIRRKPLNPRFISAFQTAGIVLIAGLMIIAVFGDILFLAKR